MKYLLFLLITVFGCQSQHTFSKVTYGKNGKVVSEKKNPRYKPMPMTAKDSAIVKQIDSLVNKTQ